MSNKQELHSLIAVLEGKRWWMPWKSSLKSIKKISSMGVRALPAVSELLINLERDKGIKLGYGSKRYREKRSIVAAFKKIGPSTVPLLVKYLKENDSPSPELFEIIGLFGPDAVDAAPILRKHITCEEEQKRVIAATTLWFIEIDNQFLLTALETLLSHYIEKMVCNRFMGKNDLIEILCRRTKEPIDSKHIDPVIVADKIIAMDLLWSSEIFKWVSSETPGYHYPVPYWEAASFIISNIGPGVIPFLRDKIQEIQNCSAQNTEKKEKYEIYPSCIHRLYKTLQESKRNIPPFFCKVISPTNLTDCHSVCTTLDKNILVDVRRLDNECCFVKVLDGKNKENCGLVDMHFLDPVDSNIKKVWKVILEELHNPLVVLNNGIE